MNTKQLRQKILDLAIRGKLVPQDSNDEPASKLLERIRAEKEQLIKDKKIKRDKNESYIFVGDDKLHYEKFADGSVVCIEDEIPFEIPKSWVWCRLKEVCKYIQRGKSPKYSEEKRFPVISQKCVRWTGLDFKPMKYITEDSLKNYETVRFLCDGDILWNSTGTGTVGRAALYISESNPFPIAVADSHVTVLRPLNVLSDYIYKYIMSPHVQVGFEDLCDGSTNQKELSLTTVCDFLVPLPSQSEQARISSTVQELLEIIEAIDNDKTELSDLIKQTKAKVLDLAIKGKLVPQDPNDEPADKLLEKIREEKEKLIKEGKLKRDKNETYIFKNSDDNSYYEQIDGETICIDDDLPFEIPDSWRWCKLRNIYNICSSKRVLQSEWKTQGVPFYRAREIVKLSQQGFVENELFISNEHYENLKANYGTPTEEDIMVSGVGTIGKAYVVKSSDKFYYKDASVLCFKRYSKFINSDLFKYLIESYFMQKQLNANSNGTTVDTITISSAGDYLYPLVPCKEQDRILLKVKNIFSYLDNLESIIKGS